MRFETPESQYMSKYFSATHPVLAEIKENLVQRGLDFMSVSPVEARMLQFLVESLQIKSIVEIGTLYGYSAVAMGLCLDEDGVIYGFEKDPERAHEARENLEKADLRCHFQVFSGPALASLKQIEEFGPFDMVFIDANKNDYCNYLDWAEKHTRLGSLVVGDNTFLFGSLWGESRDRNVGEKQIKTMEEFNRRIGNAEKYNSLMIPTLEGMTIGQRRT